MTPQDDAVWPPCAVHKDPQMRHWCEWTRQYLLGGFDAKDIEPGQRYCVPVVPIFDLYAEVSIGTEVYSGVAAQLSLVFGSDPFSLNEDLISLGMWAQGEGRLVIAATINDWAEGKRSARCESSSHGFEQEMQIQRMQTAENPVFPVANNWCLAYHLCCYPCYLVIEEKVSSTGPDSFTASTFGVNPKEFQASASSIGGSSSEARQQATQDALRARFNKRTTRFLGDSGQGNYYNSWPEGRGF